MSKSKKMRKLIKSAKMGNARSMYLLGLCCQLGKECEQDLNTAAQWMYCAADAGYEPAAQWVKDYSFDDSAAVQADS